MTKKIVKVNRNFIEAIKAEIAATKERHAKLFSQIKPEIVEKLQKMNVE